MAQLSTPLGISGTHTKSAKTIVVTWDKLPDFAKVKNYDYQFVAKSDTAKVITLAAAGVAKSAESTAGEKPTVTFTIADAAKYEEAANNYLVQVKAEPKADAEEAASDWGTEVIWVAGPSITIKIGSSLYTLSQATLGGVSGSVYKLPVSKENPLKVTYDDLKKFAEGFDITSFPDKYPNGSAISGALTISEFIIDTSKKLFSINISVTDISYEIFKGLSVEEMGLSLKRTDGSL